MQEIDKRTAPLSLRANTLWNAAGNCFYLGCQWLTTVLVVRLSDDYNNSGILAFAMAIGLVFASIGLYKVRAYQVSDLSGEYSNNDYISFRILSILAGLLCVIPYLIGTASDGPYLMASLAFLLFKSDETFVDVISGIYQCNHRMDYIGKSQFIRGVASLATFVGVLATTKNLFVTIMTMALSCILVTLFFDIPHAKLFGGIRGSFDKKKMVSLARRCFLAMIASLCLSSIVSLVRQYYGMAYGSELLGIYASVATPSILVQVAATYLYSPFIGSLAETKLAHGASAFKASFMKMLGVLLAAMLGLTIVLGLIGSKLLIFVFGPTIAPYTFLFPYVLFATTAIGVLFYLSDVLVLLRKMKAMLACDAIAMVAALALAVPLTALLGMNGINFSIMYGAGIAIIPSLIIILRAN